MRLAAALTLLLACSMAPYASALSVCPTSEFTVSFDSDSAELDASDLETLEAGAVRAHMCDVEAIELIVAGDLGGEDSLASRRVSAVREVLLRNRLSPDLLHPVNESREIYGRRVSPAADAVTILVFFD